jgi:hypothetical protein
LFEQKILSRVQVASTQALPGAALGRQPFQWKGLQVPAIGPFESDIGLIDAAGFGDFQYFPHAQVGATLDADEAIRRD